MLYYNMNSFNMFQKMQFKDDEHNTMVEYYITFRWILLSNVNINFYN